jgi:hypothetical protein
MNTEDEFQYQGKTGWHTFQVTFASHKSIKDANADNHRWRVWEGPRFVASGKTRDEAIENAKEIVDNRLP